MGSKKNGSLGRQPQQGRMEPMDKNGKEQIGVSKNVEISTDKFKQILENKTEDINRLLAGFLPQEVGEQTTVISAVNYSVTRGASVCARFFWSGRMSCVAGRELRIR